MVVGAPDDAIGLAAYTSRSRVRTARAAQPAPRPGCSRPARGRRGRRGAAPPAGLPRPVPRPRPTGDVEWSAPRRARAGPVGLGLAPARTIGPRASRTRRGSCPLRSSIQSRTHHQGGAMPTTRMTHEDRHTSCWTWPRSCSPAGLRQGLDRGRRPGRRRDASGGLPAPRLQGGPVPRAQPVGPATEFEASASLAAHHGSRRRPVERFVERGGELLFDLLHDQPTRWALLFSGAVGESGDLAVRAQPAAVLHHRPDRPRWPASTPPAWTRSTCWPSPTPSRASARPSAAGRCGHRRSRARGSWPTSTTSSPGRSSRPSTGPAPTACWGLTTRTPTRWPGAPGRSGRNSAGRPERRPARDHALRR